MKENEPVLKIRCQIEMRSLEEFLAKIQTHYCKALT